MDWTEQTAKEAVIKMNQEGRPGDLTTGMCEALNISLDNFLCFAQLTPDAQATVIKKLAGMFILELGINKFGHCSQ